MEVGATPAVPRVVFSPWAQPNIPLGREGLRRRLSLLNTPMTKVVWRISERRLKGSPRANHRPITLEVWPRLWQEPLLLGHCKQASLEGTLESDLGHFRGVCGPLGEVLGGPENDLGHLGDFWRQLKRSWRRLKGGPGFLGDVLDRLGGVFGSFGQS